MDAGNHLDIAFGFTLKRFGAWVYAAGSTNIHMAVLIATQMSYSLGERYIP